LIPSRVRAIVEQGKPNPHAFCDDVAIAAVAFHDFGRADRLSESPNTSIEIGY